MWVRLKSDKPVLKPCCRTEVRPTGGIYSAAMARPGPDVVVDHVILDRWTATDLIGALDGVPTTLVGVRLGEPELSRRERAREIRTLGQAAAQLPVVHAHVSYDLEVDTARLSAEGAADGVLRGLAQQPRLGQRCHQHGQRGEIPRRQAAGKRYGHAPQRGA